MGASGAGGEAAAAAAGAAAGAALAPSTSAGTHLSVAPLPARVPGRAGAQSTPADVMTAGWLTARTLSRTVPPAVPGIMFLSGAWLLGLEFNQRG